MKIKVKDMILVALFAALMAIGARLNVPFVPVPFSMQFPFCILAGLLLGSRLGALSQIIYMFIGLVGLPVFTKGGGPGYIFNPTFGYIIGFIAASYIVGLLSETAFTKSTVNNGKMPLFGEFDRIFISSFIAMLVLYIIGVPYLYIGMNYFLAIPKNMTINTAILVGFINFVIPDTLICVLISLIYPKIKNAIDKI